MSAADNFVLTERETGTVWLHKSKPVWIVCYEEGRMPDYIRPTYYQAYRSVVPQKRGQMPWAVDNRAFAKDGFSTLEAAMEAAQ